MLPDRVSNPGPLTYESGALLIALHGPALCGVMVPSGIVIDLISLPCEGDLYFTVYFTSLQYSEV